jgi:ribosomal protein S18 acetylase RimI-like enzyme
MADVEVSRLVDVSDADVTQINALIPQLKPGWDPVTRESVLELLASPSRLYVGRLGGEIVAFTVMVPHRHLPGLRVHIEDVVVDARHRRRGIARELLETAMEDAPAHTRSFDLRSHRDRQAAHALYRSLGFEPSDTTVFRRAGDGPTRVSVTDDG